MSVAISILDSLTATNPEIRHEEPDSNSLTANKKYMWPKQFKKWEEFNYQTIKDVYGGKLLETARRKRSALSHYPDLTPDVDCIVYNEPTTQQIITKWNHTIVQSALTPIQESFHACKWSHSAGRRKRMPGERTTPAIEDSSSRQASPLRQAATTGKRSRKRLVLKPDSGAILTCRIHGAKCPSSEIERFPKDVKVAKKWNSTELIDRFIGDDGLFTSGASRSMLVNPIRQAYTYCVHYRCRYGCILTTEEAFIFRIKPCSDDSKSMDNTSRTDALLEQKLKTDGLVEYVSIPWADNADGSSNHHEIGWDYDPLVSETLTTEVCTALPSPATPESHRRPSSPNPVRALGPRSASRKRRRSDADDELHFSFTKSQGSFTSCAQSSDRYSPVSEETDGDDTPEIEDRRGLEATSDIRGNEEPDVRSGKILKRQRSKGKKRTI